MSGLRTEELVPFPNETERLLLAFAKALRKNHPAQAAALERIAKAKNK